MWHHLLVTHLSYEPVSLFATRSSVITDNCRSLEAEKQRANIVRLLNEINKVYYNPYLHTANSECRKITSDLYDPLKQIGDMSLFAATRSKCRYIEYINVDLY